MNSAIATAVVVADLEFAESDKSGSEPVPVTSGVGELLPTQPLPKVFESHDYYSCKQEPD